MKFGDTIVRNLLAEDVNPEIIKEHGMDEGHPARAEDDKDRAK